MDDDRWDEVRTLPLEPDGAFKAFVDEFNEWWPPDYTFAGDRLARIGIEARIDGACFEIDRDGQRIDWGRVVRLDRPRHISFTWAITPDRRVETDAKRCSRVTAHFTEGQSEHCVLSLTHSDLANHGEAWATYRDMLASAMGWPLILDRFAAHCGTRAARG